jgi:peptidoglycan/LPS O-acetylase OafA/YrhL
MTVTTTLTAPTTPRVRTTSVWKTGVGAGLAASAATVGVAALARAIDIPLSVGGESIPLVGFAQATFVATIIGTVLAAVMSRRANRPAHTFVVTTLVLTAMSIVPDVLADAQTATRFVLALTHVVAAAIVVPALASRLTD